VPFFRSLLLLLALVSAARGQDGPRDAATAQNAGQAFGLAAAKQPTEIKP
jgi:hypothetical protein